MTSRRSSGSMRAESAVEPTKSENITVTWRRSARSSGCALRAPDVLAALTDGVSLASLRRAAIASSSLSRCPTAVTPSSFRVSCVRLGRTVSSISFSRNAASYFPRPRLRSQTTTSMRAPTISGGTHHVPGKQGCLGWRWGWQWPFFNSFVSGAEVEILRLRVKGAPIRQHCRAQDLKACATGNHHRHTVGRFRPC